MSAPSALKLIDVVNILKPVNKWFELGVQLEIEHSKLEEIEIEERNDLGKCKIKMVSHWLESDTTASWKKLYGALKAIDKPRICEGIITKVLQELEEEDTKDKIDREDEQHEQQQREFKEKRDKMQKEYGDRMKLTQQDDEDIRKAFREYGIEWVYDAYMKFLAQCVELEYLKDKLQVQVEESKFFKERAIKLKKRKEELCKRAQDFQQIESFLSQDESELEYQITTLQQLKGSQSISHLRDCSHKLENCRDGLKRCKKQLQICTEALETSKFQLLECKHKLTSCIRELKCLQRDYDGFIRTVNADTIDLYGTINDILENIFKGAAVGMVAGGLAGGTITGVPSALLGAAVGTSVIPVVGTAIGAFIGVVLGAGAGGVAGFIGGVSNAHIKEEIKSHLSRIKTELNEFENTRKKSQDVLEKAINGVDELEEMTRTLALRDEDQTLEGAMLQ